MADGGPDDGYSVDARLPWTADEDQALLGMMKAGGPGSWDQKAAALDGGNIKRRRTANAVAHRWRKLRAKGLGEDCPPHYSQGMALGEERKSPKEKKAKGSTADSGRAAAAAAVSAPPSPTAAAAAGTSGAVGQAFDDEGLFGAWQQPADEVEEESDDDPPEGETEEFQEKVIEELFLNENVATSVAELFAEQAAWGAHINSLQVFDSLLDMVHAALMVRTERTATLVQITRFCACCRWLKEVRGAPRINSYATFQVRGIVRYSRVSRECVLVSHQCCFLYHSRKQRSKPCLSSAPSTRQKILIVLLTALGSDTAKPLACR